MTTLRDQIPLRTRKILKKSVSRMFWMVLFGIVLSLAFFPLREHLKASEIHQLSEFVRENNDLITTVWLCLLFVLIIWSPFYEYLYLKKYFYDLDDQNLIIRKGVIVKQELTLPFNKITDVYVDQDALDVLLMLYDVHISTPTQESGRFAHIDGVDKRGSVRLRKLILDRVNRNV